MDEAVRSTRWIGASARSYWLKTLHQWHWISAAVSLVLMLLFSATGFTLNHAAQIEDKPAVVSLHAQLPAELMASLAGHADKDNAPLPAAAREWIASQLHIALDARAAEWNDGEAMLSLQTPGVDAWLSVDVQTGKIEYERTDRGWIAYFNDLHKGRHAGPLWGWFIDLFALACVLFSLTGLALLWLHGRQRAMTWPLVALGFVLPLLVALLFIH